MTKQAGYILYEGLSKIDNKPIVVIATMKTTNRKTGDMVQTWIMRSDINPVEVSQSGSDVSICGTCPHRQSLGGDCYVNIGQAPLSIFKAYKRGRYHKLPFADYEAIFKGRAIRFGAYGDPVLIPFAIVQKLASIATKHTGYTHQWQDARFNEYKPYFMASADSPSEAGQALVNGWRYFRVSREAMPNNNEVECLSVTKSIACADCGLCNGASINDRAKSIVITAHGSRSNKNGVAI
jgi:hypothetical protein